MTTFRAAQIPTAAQLEALVSDSISYAPTWVSTGTQPAIGNGSLTGYYKQIGKQVIFVAGILAGTTTTFGTGQWTIGLPAAPSQPGSPLNEVLVGEVILWDNSLTQRFIGSAVLGTSGVTGFLMPSAGTGAGPITSVTATVPFTFATSDRATFAGTYRAA